MALQILSDLKRWEEVAWRPVPDKPGMVEAVPTAIALIVYGSMAVDMGELTEENAEQYLTRLRAWEIISGAWLTRINPETDAPEDVPVTLDMLRPFFGTRVNVMTTSDSKFRQRLARVIKDRADRDGRDTGMRMTIEAARKRAAEIMREAAKR